MLSKDFNNKKKIGIIVQARMGSKRYPGKIMKVINKKPILFHMLKQLKKARLHNKIIISTSIGKENDLVRKFCKKNKISCFSGSENNLVNRYYLSAKKHKIDIIVRVTADCPLIDPKIIDFCIKKFLNNNYDFVANTSPPYNQTYPDGMDVEVFSYNTLKYVNRVCKNSFDLEHVTPFIWRNKKTFKLHKIKSKENLSYFRLTLDYIEDFKLIEKIIVYFEKNKISLTLKNIAKYLNSNHNTYSINKKRNKNYNFKLSCS